MGGGLMVRYHWFSRRVWWSYFTLHLKGAIQANLGKKGKAKSKVVDDTRLPSTPTDEPSKEPQDLIPGDTNENIDGDADDAAPTRILSKKEKEKLKKEREKVFLSRALKFSAPRSLNPSYAGEKESAITSKES